jgi:CpcD/allophycocyanin linker domain
MPGMLTGDRMVRLEVTGGGQQSISHTNSYTVTVPYNSMSRTMQNINRMGGKVVGVHVSDMNAAAPQVTTAPEPTDKTPQPNNKRGKKK